MRCAICIRDGAWPSREEDVEEVDVDKLKEMVHANDAGQGGGRQQNDEQRATNAREGAHAGLRAHTGHAGSRGTLSERHSIVRASTSSRRPASDVPTPAISFSAPRET